MEELLKLFKQRLEYLETKEESNVNNAKIVEISKAIVEVQTIILKQITNKKDKLEPEEYYKRFFSENYDIIKNDKGKPLFTFETMVDFAKEYNQHQLKLKI